MSGQSQTRKRRTRGRYLPEGEHRVTLSVRVRPETKDALDKMADDRGTSLGRALDALLERAR